MILLDTWQVEVLVSQLVTDEAAEAMHTKIDASLRQWASDNTPLPLTSGMAARIEISQ